MSSFLYTVNAFFIIDNKGNRVIAKYFRNDFENVNKQKAFEKKVFEKTSKANGEIALLENYLIVYRAYSNIIIYMVGDSDQNEIALLYALNTFTDSLETLLDNQINKKTVLDGINYTLLTLDEILDEGIVMESDPSVIVDRVGIKLPESDDLDDSIGKVISSAVNFLK
ncbi:longin domain-containing protein [Tieghemostelium lacteum]|uniref:Zeta-coat protein n=1 Tax=Tieghemostelium lacteum TaxID=361077 RepID=A0A151Z3B9_TIELA|nr:longin domain-containing protein [Tieghemostelium lacteum]|eukprot:KYQ88450.1 longin domain-containing protein [Tieghemostelium lacteum]